MSKTIGIAGAGLMGRMLALELVKRDWKVTLFDEDFGNIKNSAAYVGAGMLAPFCEFETTFF